LPRSVGVIRRQGLDSKALRAALTARSMSSLPLSGTRLKRKVSAGFSTSKSFPEQAGTHWPSIKLCLGRFNHAVICGRTPGFLPLEGAFPLP